MRERRPFTRTVGLGIATRLLTAAAGLALLAASEAPAGDRDLDAYELRTERRERFWADAAARAQVVGQDGGAPVSLAGGDGAVVWLFGDTFVKGGFPTNTGLRVTVGEGGAPRGEYLLDGAGRACEVLPVVPPERADRHRIWPTGGIALGERTYVFFDRVRLTGKPGPWGFEPAGCGLARARAGEWPPRFERVAPPEGHAFPFAAHAVVQGKDGRVHLYYVKRAGLGSAAFVASVPADGIEDPRRYEMPAEPLVTDVHGQVSVAWNPFLERYVLLHVGGLRLGPRSVYVRTAREPTGPFSEPVRVLERPGALRENLKGLLYAAYLHPELFREGGRVMAFTVCQLEDVASPDLYEIELTLR